LKPMMADMEPVEMELPASIVSAGALA
jgi:hypothetical protein